jgi:hypothetical protein
MYASVYHIWMAMFRSLDHNILSVPERRAAGNFTFFEEKLLQNIANFPKDYLLV